MMWQRWVSRFHSGVAANQATVPVVYTPADTPDNLLGPGSADTGAGARLNSPPLVDGSSAMTIYELCAW